MADHPARLVAIEGNNNQGRRAAQGPVMKTTPKRSSKKGPGPHLKKHQILQQQLQQIQREQEELEIQHALHLRQQHHQKQAPKQRQQHHELVRTRYSPFSQRSQQLHKNVAQAQQQQQQHQYQDDRLHHAHHPYHPQQPQPGRPPKQRVLMRSESASSVLHGGQLSPQYPAPPQFHSHSNQQLIYLRPQQQPQV
ncbi:hypothetical protein BGZ83_001926 [Gryganskiella cystojenkinii]|nr:hypothetical protein BGZ83_001926 [Gryganskiella cystojenkinii]